MAWARGTRVRVVLPVSEVTRQNLPSREWDGIVVACHYDSQGRPLQLELEQAVPVSRESLYCLACGQPLTSGPAQLFGYGPGCAARMGFPTWTVYTPEQVAELREQIPAQFMQTLRVSLRGTTQVQVLRPAQGPALLKRYDVAFTVVGGSIHVTVRPEYTALVHTVPGGRWDAGRQVWQFPATPVVARQLRQAFAGVRRVGTRAFVALLEQADAQQRAGALKRRTDLPPIRHLRGGGWQHQRAAFAFMVQMLTGRPPVGMEPAAEAPVEG
jgi:hypothetical protein